MKRWLFSLLVAALLPSALVAADANDWIHGRGYFHPDDTPGVGSRWTSVGDGTDISHWIQAGSSAGVIELFNPSNEIRIKLYADHMDLKYPGDDYHLNYAKGHFGKRRKFTYTDLEGTCAYFIRESHPYWRHVRPNDAPDRRILLNDVGHDENSMTLEGEKNESFLIVGDQLLHRSGTDQFAPFGQGTWSGDK